jgi:hypothetical protein
VPATALAFDFRGRAFDYSASQFWFLGRASVSPGHVAQQAFERLIVTFLFCLIFAGADPG